MRLLITGGCGFLGANMAAEALRRGDALWVLDDLSRTGSDRNLAWLRAQGEFGFVRGDVRDRAAVEALVREARPDAVFHLAGQVAMTTSLADPRRDFEVNVGGSINMLEAVRAAAPEAAVLFSSTNKIYGDLDGLAYDEAETRWRCPSHPRGFDESLPLDFRSPYGCSKGAADQYMLDYARTFGLRTAVFRHSSIFGPRQFSTADQGWVGWFVERALAARTSSEPFTISGDGKQVRDVLFAPDIVRCYFGALAALDRCAGQAFNIGGGAANSLSLLELFAALEAELGVRLAYTRLPWRKSDQKVFVADTAKALERFGWAPQVDMRAGLRGMIRWVEETRG